MSGQSGGHRLRLSKLNEQLTCTLCTGYLIDATTIIECLHSFCRSCIVKYLEVNKYCPICEVLVHKSKPLLNIRPDHTLQDIVYKLVPGCYQNEMRCRREFYAKHPDGKNSTMSPESRGEPIESHIYSPDESLSLSLEYFSPNTSSDCEDSKEIVTKPLPRRYLRCPAAVTVFHLQKLIRAKYGLSEAHRVDIMYKEEPLCGSYTLMDVMYIYHWRRKVPLHLSYRIFESSPKRIKLSEDNNDFTQSLSNTGISPVETKDEQPTKRGWKEVQLKISETGVMSVTDITNTDSKKSTKVKEIDDQNRSDFLQNVETLESVNKPLALEEETARSSTSKSKNLISEFDDRKISQETKRKESFDSKSQDSKAKNEAKEKDSKEVKEAKDSKESKESKEMKEKKENKKEKKELPGKSKREELEITSRVPETEKSGKRNESPKENQKKEKNVSSAGSKIDALSAKLQFQPKVGQVNNTYSKKTLKDKKTIVSKLEAKKDLKTQKDSKIPEASEPLSKSSEAVSKVLEGSSKNPETVFKNMENVSKSIDVISKNAEVSKNTEASKSAEVSKNAEVSKITEVSKNTEVSKSTEVSKNAEVSKSTEVSKSIGISKSSGIMNSTSVSTYVTAPSISSERSQGMSLQQALTSFGKPGDSKSLLNQLNASQKSSFRNNNLSPSSESLASIGLNVSTTMMMGQGSNFGFMMSDLGMMSPGSKSQVQVSPVSVSQVHSLSKVQSSSPVQTISVQSSPVQSSSQIQSSSQSQSSFQIQSKVTTSGMPQFNVQPSMSIYSISGKNNLYNQSSSKSSKSDFEITSVYPIPPSQDTIPISLMKPSIRKHEVIAKGTNLNEICAKIGTSGSKINDICAKIGENSKEKNKTETRRPDLPDLLKITKPNSEFLKHIPNIPNVPIYTPSGNSSLKDLKNSVPSGVSTSQKIPQKKHPHVGYKTLRDPPKSWNPTLSKNNYVAVKNQSQNQFADGGSSKPILSKPAKIFKMRNMPRYLGNPASGVKPMYGISNEKEKEQASKNNMNANTMTMMKIDPKTLSPIVSTVNSPIVSPPPYSPNARSYQNSPFSRDICRNTGSPISPRNSPVNMLSTNPFIPSPTPNTNPRLIYSHFPPPFPDASRFPNPLIRTPVGIPPPSAFHSSLPPSINKLYQRSSYIPQTSGYNPVTQPPTVQRIPPSTHSSPKSSPTLSVSFNLGKAETVVSTSSEKGEKVFNLSKSDVSDLSEKKVILEEKCKEKSEKKKEKIDLESKINGDIIDLEEEEKEKEKEKEKQKKSGKETLKEVNQSSEESNQSSKELNQSSKESNQSFKESNQPSKDSKEISKEPSKDLKEVAKPSSNENSNSSKESLKENPKDSSKEMESLKDNLKESSKDSKESRESLKESREEESKNPQENLPVEKSKDLPQEKIEEVEKEIQGKKTEIQRNKAES